VPETTNTTENPRGLRKQYSNRYSVDRNCGVDRVGNGGGKNKRYYEKTNIKTKKKFTTDEISVKLVVVFTAKLG
jgi:hypothetical protein